MCVLMMVAGTVRLAEAQLALPVLRPIGQPPGVAEAGIELRSDGRRAQSSRLALFALTDLQLYTTQLETLFPRSADYYPADSLRQVKVQRAKAWVTRLREAERRREVVGSQRLDFALVAVRAEEDSVAHRLIDTRLAEVPAGRDGALQRSEALVAAVMALTDTTLDSARIVRALPRAEQYAERLWSIPASGFTTRTDSTDVLHRKVQVAMTLLVAAATVSDAERLARYTTQSFRFIDQLAFRERREALQEYPYALLATAFMTQPNSHAQLDSLEHRMASRFEVRAGEASSPEEYAVLTSNAAAALRHFRELSAWIGQIGHPAPPITAHVWFNTPDSVYAPNARAHSLADGVVRVLVFGSAQSDVLPVLERLQHHFPSGAQVVFVTQINGYVGLDLKTPSEEVAWLAQYYRVVRHVTVPVALWAGNKITNDYGWSMPIAAPTDVTYHTGVLAGKCVLVDGRGIVRRYLDLDSRDDEARIIRVVQTLMQTIAQHS